MRYDKILQQWEDEFDEDFSDLDELLRDLDREPLGDYLSPELDLEFRKICVDNRREDNLFDWITPQIAVGRGPWQGEDFRNLVRAGVTHVVDARGESRLYGAKEWNLYAPGDVNYLWCGFSDDFRHKPIDIFREPIQFALDALRNDPKAKVFAHCAAGMNRGPSVAYGILRAHTGMSPDDALAAMRRVRPIACAPYRGDVDEALRVYGFCD